LAGFRASIKAPERCGVVYGGKRKVDCSILTTKENRSNNVSGENTYVEEWHWNDFFIVPAVVRMIQNTAKGVDRKVKQAGSI
jgi:hypothetical protein